MALEQYTTDLIAFADALPYGVLIARASGTPIYWNAAWRLPHAMPVLSSSTNLLDAEILGTLLTTSGYHLEQVAVEIEQLAAGTLSQIALSYRSPHSLEQIALKLTRLPVYDQVYLIVQQQAMQPAEAPPALLASADPRDGLLSLSQAMATTLSLDDMLRQFHEAFFALFAYDTLALFLLDPDTQRLRMVSRIEPGSSYIYPDDWSVPMGEGLLTLIFHSQAGLFVNDAQHHPASSYPAQQQPAVDHLMGVPLFGQSGRLGVLLIERYSDPGFTQEQYDLFTWFAAQATPAIANAALFTGVQQRVHELDLLRRAQLALAREVGLDATMRRAVEVVHQVLGYPRVGLHLIHHDPTRIVLQHQIGYAPEYQMLIATGGVIGRAIANRAPELVREVQHDPDFIGGSDTGSELAIPLFDGDEVIGALNIETERNGMLNEDDLDLLVLYASYVSQAIARARLYSALREREQRFQALIAHTNEVIFILDRYGTIQYVSPAVERVLGYTPEELHGKPFLSYLLTESDTAAPPIDDILSWTGGEYRMAHRSQQLLELELHVTNLLDMPIVNGLVINCHDVTRLKQVARQMRHQALYDALTGLPNRAFLMEQLDRLFAKRTSTRPAQPDAADDDMALLFIDLDDFKLINDTLGHPVGDEFLKQIAARLLDELPEQALVARLGGDEFTVILPVVQHDNAAVETAELVQASLDRPLHVAGFELRARASIGVALHASSFESPIDLLRAADTAMYRAKKTGKNQVVVFDTSMYNEVAGQLRMQLDLPHAIGHGELELEYHPIVELATGIVRGMRAELFWNHPRLGRMAYDVFAEAAEAIRFVPTLLHWAVSEALYHLRLWLDATGGEDPPRLHLALRHAYLREPGMCRSITAIAQTTGVPLHYMVADVCSKAVLAGDSETRASLSCLAEQGMNISVVGPGLQEALVMLPRSVQPLCVGIPRLVSDTLEHDPRSIVIARTVISMAHNLDMKVQATNITHELQADMLRAAACDFASGLCFSRPLPGLAVAAVLRRGSHMLVLGEAEHMRVLEAAGD